MAAVTRMMGQARVNRGVLRAPGGPRAPGLVRARGLLRAAGVLRAALPRALSGLVAATALAAVLAAAAPPACAATGDPDSLGYTWADRFDGCSGVVPPFGAGAITEPAATGVVGPVALPWNWDFLGTTVTQAWISPTGYVTFSDQGPASQTPQVLPNGFAPNDLIAAFWFNPVDAHVTHEGRPEAFHVRWEQLAPSGVRTEIHLLLLPGGAWRMIWVDAAGVAIATIGQENADASFGRTLHRNRLNREPDFPTPDGGQAVCVLPPARLDCSAPVALSCDSFTPVVLGGVAGASDYSCAQGLLAGEAVAFLELTSHASVAISLSDPQAHLLRLDPVPPCSEWRCTADLGDVAEFPVLAPGTYWFAVDHPSGSGLGVDVLVVCEPLGPPLSCGDGVAGDTAGGSVAFDERTCTTDDMAGPERFHRLSLPAATDLALELVTDEERLWVQLHDAAEFDASGSACLTAGRGGLSLSGVAAGEYVVVVDGPVGSGAAYTLHVDCESSGAFDCGALPELACNSSVFGDLAPPSARSVYPCNSRALGAGEAAWRFVNPVDQEVSFDLVSAPAGALVLLAPCGEEGCLLGSASPRCRSLPAGEYVVIVDGARDASGPVELAVSCEGVGVAGVDLRVAGLDLAGTTSDCVGLEIAGTVGVDILNAGSVPAAIPFEVVVFHDADGDGGYGGPFVDTVLGQETAPPIAASSRVRLDVAIAGVLPFRDAPLLAVVDVLDAVAESDETNNLRSSSEDCDATGAAGAFEPRVAWEWTGSSVAPSHVVVASTPLVGDVDGDGVPDVVFTAKLAGRNEAVIRALSGRDGAELWTAVDPGALVAGWSQPALADLDGDGLPEVIAQSALDYTRLIAVGAGGVLRWTSEPVVGGIGLPEFSFEGPSVADIDGDGSPEIAWGAEVLRADGSRYWTPEAGGTTGRIAAIADVLGDARQEVIVGPTAYEDDGSGVGRIAWRADGVPDGRTAVGDLDQDGRPEVVVVGDGRVVLIDGESGTVLWNIRLPWGGADCSGDGAPAAAPPVIADFDGDCLPEIGVLGKAWITIFDADGRIDWRSAVPSCTAITSPTAFDFQGDGAVEVIYLDDWVRGSDDDVGRLRILDGRTGTEILSLPTARREALPMAVIADVDADERAEIVVPLAGPNPGIRVYEDRWGGWVPTRRVWNQHAYHVTNVLEDGTIPAVEPPSWTSHGTYRTQLADDAVGAADLTMAIVDHEVRLTPGCTRELVVTARVGNAGRRRAGAAFECAVFDGDPDAGGTLLGSFMVDDLLPGEYRDLMVPVPLDRTGVIEVHALADGNDVGRGVVRECREDNNRCVLLVDNPAEGIDLPADVGPALRATGHGPAGQATVSASFEWSGDAGAPRGLDEHYHVYRGLDPVGLLLVSALEPHRDTTYEDETPATPAADLPAVHFFAVLAADECEQPSRD